MNERDLFEAIGDAKESMLVACEKKTWGIWKFGVGSAICLCLAAAIVLQFMLPPAPSADLQQPTDIVSEPTETPNDSEHTTATTVATTPPSESSEPTAPSTEPIITEPLVTEPTESTATNPSTQPTVDPNRPSQGLEMKYDPTLNCYAVTGIGYCQDRNIVIPATYGVGNIPVKQIYRGAFENCTRIVSITIPEGVEVIGDTTFNGCANLQSIRLPNSLTKLHSEFAGCTSLKELNIPADTVFYWFEAPALENVNIAPGHASYCSVDGIVYTLDMTEIRYYPAGRKDKEFTVPTGVKTINSAFKNCAYLERIIVSEGVETIRRAAFSDCARLTDVQLPTTLTKMEDSVFSHCTALERIELPDQLRLLGAQLFYGCTNLKEVSLPAELQRLDDYMFCGCTSLKTIRIPEGVRQIGTSCFEGCIALEEVEAPGLNSISNQAFKGCVSLKDLSFIAKIGEFRSNAFENCTGLTTVVLPETLYTCGDGAFTGCTNLTAVYLPAKFPAIRQKTFQNCPNLRDIHFDGTIEEWGEMGFVSEITSGEGATVHCTDGTIHLEQNLLSQ